jgi:hypothetical protein
MLHNFYAYRVRSHAKKKKKHPSPALRRRKKVLAFKILLDKATVFL